LVPVDAGINYYAKFKDPLPTSPSFFPIGVWFQSVTQPSDITSDKAAGINTYVELTANSDLGLVKSGGMHAIISQRSNASGGELSGWLVSDESDMNAGPGNATWTGNYSGNVCSPASAPCGYTMQRNILNALPKDDRIRYANYGKGVTFWETKDEAAEFVNDFQDVLSADNYWLTDDSICSAPQGGTFYPAKDLTPASGGNSAELPPQLCHLPYNYALTVDNLRALVSPKGSRPVWAFIELGHPFTENNWPSATPAGIYAAVWNSLIAGARGIIYFDHSFGGPCETQSALRDSCYVTVRGAVTSADRQVDQLAPALNAPTVNGLVKASSGVNYTVKWYDRHFYIFAASKQAQPQVATFSMPCVGTAHVTTLFTDAPAIAADNGTFTESFLDGNAVHLFRVDGGSNCDV
jgi:hypothetical protein